MHMSSVVHGNSTNNENIIGEIVSIHVSKSRRNIFTKNIPYNPNSLYISHTLHDQKWTNNSCKKKLNDDPCDDYYSSQNY